MTTLGAGVDGSVRRIDYGYDSQGNLALITSYDAPSGGNIVNQVQRVYNGLGQLTAEYQATNGAVNPASTPVVQYAYDEMANGVNDSRPVSMTYPNGRVLNYNYNSGLDNTISRLSSISDSSGTLEAYSYLGLNTIVVRSHPQIGVDLTYLQQAGQPTGDAGDQYTGLDRFGRVVDQLWVNDSTGAATDQFLYGYDADSNVLYQNNGVNAVFAELYHASGAGNGYDDLNQLTAFARGTLSASTAGGTPDTIADPSHSQSWQLDVLGNWQSVTTDGATQSRTVNAQNQVTAIGSAALTYDANGNMTTDASGRHLVYDAWNRLVGVQDGSGNTQAVYRYDGLGRRITEIDGTSSSTLYYSAQWQVLEERDSTGAVQAQYVWSAAGVDTLVLRDRASHGGGVLDERLYAQQDANGDVTALVNTAGQVVERYIYDPYGAVTVLAPDWTTRTGSLYNSQYLYQGGRYDGAVDLYDFRNREYSPTLGRWVSQDPLGFAAGDPNLYRFVGNSPVGNSDPSGLIVNLLGQALVGAGAGALLGGGMAALRGASLGQIFNAAAMGAAQGAVAGATFGVVSGAGTGLGFLFGITRGSGLAASALGAATIAEAGILSGQAARAIGNVLTGQSWDNCLGRAGDMAGDALLALGLYAASGARFSDIAPESSLNLSDASNSARTFLLDEAGTVPLSAEAQEALLAERAALTAPEGNLKPGSFSIRDWSGYPGGAPKPSGPFSLLEGAEYEAARKAANEANAALRAADPASYAGKQIHEIQPVKFGGSPTDPTNKIALDPVVHRQFNAWWYRLQKSLE